jgi:hypothetical protein
MSLDSGLKCNQLLRGFPILLYATRFSINLRAKSKNPHMAAAIAANCTEPLTLGGMIRLVPAKSKLCSPFDDVCKTQFRPSGIVLISFDYHMDIDDTQYGSLPFVFDF